jgi:hypothetical protein
MALVDTGIISAVGGAGAMGLFNYNRMNFRFDVTLRFERFQSQREWAIGQCTQYRNDLRKLQELTVKKCSTYHMTMCLIIATNMALFGAGRLGLHGPSPPGWIMGLFLTHNAVSFCYLMLGAFMGMHASQRCAAASTQILTRHCRLPVPTKQEMDQARKLSSDFEQQKWADIFRVPYIMKGAEYIPNIDGAGRGSGRSRSAPAKKRTSGWYQDEWIEDKGYRGGEGSGSAKEVPEHFRQYTAVQEEWYQQECYVRVCIFYGVESFVLALAFYALGHINVELRAFWASYASPLCLALGHALLASHDVVAGQKKGEMLKFFEYMGSLSVLIAAIGMSLEFRVKFDIGMINLAWAFVIIAYLMNILYGLRLLELCYAENIEDPTTGGDMPEIMGASWWPKKWEVPAAFRHVMFLVAPPSRVFAGQNDLVQETRNGIGGGSGNDDSADISDLGERCSYIFDGFDTEQVRDRLSEPSKNELRALHAEFQQQRRQREPSSVVVSGILAKLGDIARAEGVSFEGQGLASHDSKPTPYQSGQGLAIRGKKRGKGPLLAPPTIVAAISIAFTFAWCFMLLGIIIECFMGEQVFLTAPHWARPPMTRPSKAPYELAAPLGGGGPWHNIAGYREWLPEHMEFYDEERCGTPEEAAALGEQAHTFERYGTHCANKWRRLAVFGGRKVHEPHSTHKKQALAGALRSLLGAIPTKETMRTLLQREPMESEESALREALAAFEQPSSTKAVWVEPSKLSFQPLEVAWPAFFEPHVLACRNDGAVAALTPRGAAMTLKLGHEQEVRKIRLSGLSQIQPLVAASWGAIAEEGSGLTLVTRRGDLLSCLETGAEQSWPCLTLDAAPKRLPLGEKQTLLAASAAWLQVPGLGEERKLFAAMVTNDSPDVAALFQAETGAEGTRVWMPFGDVSIPHGLLSEGRSSISLSFWGNEILIMLDDGTLVRRRLLDGRTTTSLKASSPWRAGVGSAGGHGGAPWWKGACGYDGNRSSVMQLSLHRSDGAWQPQLAMAELDAPMDIIRV